MLGDPLKGYGGLDINFICVGCVLGDPLQGDGGQELRGPLCLRSSGIARFLNKQYR